MDSYRTIDKVVEPGQVVVAVPYAPGEIVEVVVRPTSEDRQERLRRFYELMKETQSLPQVQNLTDEDIEAEIEAYRAGR